MFYYGLICFATTYKTVFHFFYLRFVTFTHTKGFNCKASIFRMTEKDFKRHIDNFSDDVLRYLAKNMQDTDEAKDIVQDTFISLWENRAKVDNQKAKSWLFTTAHNKMLNALRYKKIRQETKFEQQIDKNNLENEQMVDYLLKQLPQTMQQCLILKDWQGFSIKEISDILHISEANVKVNIFRAKIKLKALKSE